jgi:hypothetical protein
LSTTITTEAAERAPVLPEWRRICHILNPGTQRSFCGTAPWKPGEGHYEGECKARGHSVCVVCLEIEESINRG